ncbi:MAG: hypothetical protein IPI39_03630 [Candidatus Obscuribacter sp.]|nr:hypothetical protein [Candidatus Obscuribacter sp.]
MIYRCLCSLSLALMLSAQTFALASKAASVPARASTGGGDIDIAPPAKQETFVTGLDYAPDGQSLVVSYRNRPPALIQNQTGQVLLVFGFSPEEDADKRSMVLSGQSKTYRRMFSRNSLLRRPSDLTACDFGSDGKKIVAAGPGIVRIFDVQSSQQEVSFPILENAALSHTDNPNKFDGLLVNSGGSALLGSSWSAGSLSVRYSPDQTRLAVCQPFGCSVRDAKSGEQIYDFHHTDIMGGRYVAVFSPDGKYLAVLASGSSADKMSCRVDVLNARDGHVLFTYPREPKGALKPAGDLAFDPLSEQLGCFTSSGKLLIFDTKSWQLRHTLNGGDSLAFAPDGKQVIVTSRDEVAELINIADGRVVKTYKTEHPDAVTHIKNRPLAWSPDGKWAAIGAEEFNIVFWHVK